MTETQQLIDDAQDAADEARIAQAHADLSAELDAEDAAQAGPGGDGTDVGGMVVPGNVDPHYVLGSFWARLETFLKAQPDVTDLAEAGVPGYYGFRLAAAGDVSLVCQFTSGNTLADGSVA